MEKYEVVFHLKNKQKIVSVVEFEQKYLDKFRIQIKNKLNSRAFVMVGNKGVACKEVVHFEINKIG